MRKTSAFAALALAFSIAAPALAFEHEDYYGYNPHRHHSRETSRHQHYGGHYRYQHRDWGHHVHPRHPCRPEHGHWVCK